MEEKIEEIVLPILEEWGLELIDVELLRREGGRRLCLYVDREGGVTLEELQEVSRAVETPIEVEETVPGGYRLEVSSPGLDRPWKRLRDFERHVGSQASVTLRNPLPSGRNHFHGTLVEVRGEQVRFLAEELGEITFPFGEVARAKPVLNWEKLLKKRDEPASQ